MRPLRRRDRVRTCLRCGETWRVPAALAKVKRAGRWTRGGSGADFHAFGSGTALFDAAIKQAIDAGKARSQAADASDHRISELGQCPNCGSGAWTEQKAPR